MTEESSNTGPLEGVRIIDMTSVVMGPYATLILADFGADVIKVESPAGDTTRRVPPMRQPGMGSTFLHTNRNKRSIVIDLKHADGVQALLALLRTADVLVYNVRPRAMERLGLGKEVLAAVNPRLVTISLVGFGQDGPYAGHPAYEDLIQGLTAVPSMLVDAGSQTPHYVPLSFNDRAVGLNGAIALLSALYRRERSGRGQHIEVPMFETMVQATYGDHLGGLSFEPPLGPPGYARQLNKERRPYRTLDGHICVIAYTDRHWQAFFELIGQPGAMAADPRLRDIGSRTEHASAVYALMAEHMLTRGTAEWLDCLRRADIPATPLHTLHSILEDPHLLATGFIRTVEHPSEGAILQMGIPSKWSESQPSVRRLAPLLGQHTEEVLREAGLEERRIAQLLASGAVRGHEGLPRAAQVQDL